VEVASGEPLKTEKMYQDALFPGKISKISGQITSKTTANPEELKNDL